MTKGFFPTSKFQRQNLHERFAHCGSCGLYKTCKSPKMQATGKGRKKILFIAESPGKTEDERNIQLVGKAGKLLRRYLKGSHFDLDRDAIKINAINCRPPNNRKPDDTEIEACRPNVMKAIKEYEPNVIVLLGGIACKSLLSIVWGREIGAISRWAGFCIPCRNPNAWIIPTFHPSYLCRREKDILLHRAFKEHLKLAIEKSKSKPWKEIPDYEKEVEVIIRPSEAAKILKEMLRKKGLMSFDYETNCLKPDGEGTEIISCSVCWRGKRTISYPWQGEAIEATDNLLKSNMPKIAANLKFEDRWTRVKLGHRVRNWYFDTVLAAHVLDNRPGITSVKFQAFVLLGQGDYDSFIKPYLQSVNDSRFNRIKELNLKNLLLYGGKDSYLEYHIAEKQVELMEKTA